MGCSKSGLSGCRDPLPPLPLLTKEGSENRQKSPTRFGEEPIKRILIIPGMSLSYVALGSSGDRNIHGEVNFE